MKYLTILLFLLIGFGNLHAQHWSVFLRTHNDLVPLQQTLQKNDTLKLTPGNTYQIELPDIFAQKTGTPTKKMMLRNISEVQHLIDFSITHDKLIKDLTDTIYTAKVTIQQLKTLESEKLSFAPQLVIKGKQGSTEMSLTILPQWKDEISLSESR